MIGATAQRKCEVKRNAWIRNGAKQRKTAPRQPHQATTTHNPARPGGDEAT